ncbi:hypothetical protein ACFFRR_007294 [Megaselia abdita]
MGEVSESSYKSLNSELVKSIQNMKSTLNLHRQEVTKLNGMVISERENYAFDKLQLQLMQQNQLNEMKNSFEKQVSSAFEKLMNFISKWDFESLERQMGTEEEAYRSMRSTHLDPPPRRPQSENISPNPNRLSIIARSSLEENLAQKCSPRNISIRNPNPPENVTEEAEENEPESFTEQAEEMVQEYSESEENSESEQSEVIEEDYANPEIEEACQEKVPKLPREEETQEGSEYEDCYEEDTEDHMTTILEEDTFIDSTVPNETTRLSEANIDEAREITIDDPSNIYEESIGNVCNGEPEVDSRGHDSSVVSEVEEITIIDSSLPIDISENVDVSRALENNTYLVSNSRSSRMIRNTVSLSRNDNTQINDTTGLSVIETTVGGDIEDSSGSDTLSPDTTNRSISRVPHSTQNPCQRTNDSNSDEENFNQSRLDQCYIPIQPLRQSAFRKIRETRQSRMPLKNLEQSMNAGPSKERIQKNSNYLGPPSMYKQNLDSSSKSRFWRFTSSSRLTRTEQTNSQNEDVHEMSTVYSRTEPPDVTRRKESLRAEETNTDNVENLNPLTHEYSSNNYSEVAQPKPSSSKQSNTARNPRRECVLLPPRINLLSESKEEETSDEEVSEICKRPLSTNRNTRNDTTMFQGFTSTSTPRKSFNSTLKLDKLVVNVKKLSMNQISNISNNVSGRPRRAVTPTMLREPNLRDKLRSNEFKETVKKKRTTRLRKTRTNSESSDLE